MQAIINTYAKSYYGYLNGQTLDISGHSGGFILVEVDEQLIPFSPQEILIVDIQTIYRHAIIREEKLGFDYWANILRRYLKTNGIKLNISQKEKPIAEHPEIESNLAEINDEDIL
jgi:hypothetical protein